ncbi:MAG: RagB/SusD family nutrient uptake outer membrane protein, partial [Chitinophagaceae bacterium]|nr:RagB/SusD family nutrient uptake outer membrane protein [Chitinophagaceae bacterium]
ALIDANGFVTNELMLRNAGNTAELQLSTGGSAVDPTNTVLLNIWTKSNKIISDADSVLSFASRLEDPSYSSGLVGFTSIYKALSIGNMSMLWEKIPAGIGTNVSFIDREEGFQKAIDLLDDAIQGISANAPNAKVSARLPKEVDLLNTLNALKARYSLYIGDYATAITAADAVDLTKASVIAYNSLAQNAVFESATSTNNVYQPVDSTLGLPADLAPDLADQRIPFYIGINPTTAPRHRIKGFFASGTSSVPLYLPGEMLLIKAEALARQDMLPEAVTELNKVITKTPAEDVYGVGAGLPEFSSSDKEEILTEIYRQRCIELFMSGLKLEDMRRFDRSMSERKRNFFPYPFPERDNNPNTPADPEF